MTAPAPSVESVESVDAIPAGCVSVAEAARVLGCDGRTVQRRCRQGLLPAVRDRRGRWWIRADGVPALRIARGEPAAPLLADDPLAGLSARQRAGIVERYRAVRAYEQALAHRPAGMSAELFGRRFVEAWRAVHAAARISVRSLLRWRQKVRRGGIGSLADRRGSAAAPPPWSPEAMEFIVGMYLSENRPNLAVCRDRCLAIAASRGWAVPALRRVQEYVAEKLDPKLIDAGRDPRRFRDRAMPDVLRDWSRVAAMECWVADHRLLDLFVPRRVDGEWRWHRPWLTMYLDARSWMPVAWSLRFESPDANQVMSVFTQGIREHGCPQSLYLDNGKDFRARRFAGGRTKRGSDRRSAGGPPEADRSGGQARPLNDAAARPFNGGACPAFPSRYDVGTGTPDDQRRRRPPRKPSPRPLVPEDVIAPVLELLRIGVTWALPYNARAKLIEPFFRIMSERFDRTFDTYAGHDERSRPESTARLIARKGSAAEAAAGGLDLDAVRRALAAWIAEDYALRESPSAASKPRSALAAFRELRAVNFEVRRPTDEDLALLLMPSRPVVVARNGIYVRAHRAYYWADELEGWRCASGRDTRRKVIYKYDDGDASRIWVFDRDGRFLCIARPRRRAHPLAATSGDARDAEDLGTMIAAQRRIRNALAGRTRELQQSSHEALLAAQAAGARAAGRLEPPPAPAPPAPPVVPLAGEISAAAQAGGAEPPGQAAAAIGAAEFYARATGTDDSIGAEAAGPASAIEILAEAYEEESSDGQDG